MNKVANGLGENGPWVKSKHKEWQGHWHQLFDADPELSPVDALDPPEPAPEELDEDFRLIYDFSVATPDTRQKCMAILPSGSEISARFEDFMAHQRAPMSGAAGKKKIG